MLFVLSLSTVTKYFASSIQDPAAAVLVVPLKIQKAGGVQSSLAQQAPFSPTEPGSIGILAGQVKGEYDGSGVHTKTAPLVGKGVLSIERICEWVRRHIIKLDHAFHILTEPMVSACDLIYQIDSYYSYPTFLSYSWHVCHALMTFLDTD